MNSVNRHTSNIRADLKAIDELIAEAEAEVAKARALIERLSDEVDEQRELVRTGSVVAFERPADALEWIANRLAAEQEAWEE